jgi:signal recognition particle receptor subunit beta
MVFFNYSTMQMAAKVVYYGPGLCGKTTNLQWIYDHTSNDSRGEMVSLATETDRTLFFDLLPIDVGSIAGFSTRIQLYTVPGQVFYNTTRKLVLKGVDGVVFVADSQKPMVQANIESFQNLEENLAEMGLSLDTVPVVLQFNKRDLPSICTVEEMNESLNRGNWPYCEASALNGSGVLDTLKMISKATLMALKKRLTKGRPETATPAVKRPAVAAPAPPPARPAVAPPPPRPAPAPAAPLRSTTGASTGPFAVPSYEAPPPDPRFESQSGVHREPAREALPPLDPPSFEYSRPSFDPSRPSFETPRPASEATPEPASFENVFSSFELTPDAAPAEPVLAPIQPALPARDAPPARQPEPYYAPAPAFAPAPPRQPEPPAFRDLPPASAAPPRSEPARSEPPAAPVQAAPVVPAPAHAAPVQASNGAADAPAKPRTKSSGLDALAELEKLRKEAFTPKQPAKPVVSSEPKNGKQEISRELRLLMSRTNFNRARRFSLTVQLEDAEHRPVDVARHLHVDLDDVSSLEQLLLRLDIALQSSA